MNYALWKKAVSDAWLTLAVSSALLILFCWLFVWLMAYAAAAVIFWRRDIPAPQ